MSPSAVLVPKFSAAIEAAFGSDFRRIDPVLRPSQFADVQANAALALAKQLGIPPREAAARIVEHLDLADMCEPVEVSGPGFINVRFRDNWLAAQATAVSADPRLGVPDQDAETIVIDYSAPNGLVSVPV